MDSTPRPSFVLRERLMPHLAARIFNEPLAIEPVKAYTILSAIGPRIGLAPIEMALPPTVVRQDRSHDYQVLEGGVAVVPIFGTLVKRNEGGMLAESGMTSMEAIRETLATALADPTVRAILLHVDSYGGEAIGTAELANFIFAARDTKPIWCAYDDNGYSAACYLGAAADRVYVSPSGGTGSIGVITFHVDESAAIAAEGLVVTPIFAGEQKADGFPSTPLSDRARTRIQARVDGIWDLFLADVAKFRGLSKSTVRGFQAGTFYGRDAVRVGLATHVGTFDDAVTALQARSGRPGTQRKETRMEPTTTPGAPTALDASVPGEKVIPLAQARSETEAARIAARLEGAQEEKARATRIRGLAAIVRLPKEKAEALATKLIDEGVKADDAQGFFVQAQAEHEKLEAGKAAILGHTAHEPAGAPPIPPMLSREAVLAQRAVKMRSRQPALQAAIRAQEGAV